MNGSQVRVKSSSPSHRFNVLACEIAPNREAPMKGREQLDEEIDALAAWLPTMLAETAETDQMDAFAGRAEPIQDEAAPDDAAHVQERLQRLLVEHCLIPADEGPCG